MPGGFAAFPQGRFPNDLPPTIFSPASPKVNTANPTKEAKDIDAESMASQATFSSTVSLIKKSAKSKLQLAYDDLRARKDPVAQSTADSEKKSSSKKSLPKDSKTPRQRTTEAYMYVAQFK